MHNKSFTLTAVAALTALASATTTRAQSADALIDKLVDKGILTVKEAKDLREEADKGFTQSYQVKSGLPDWVTTLRLAGDLRARYDGIWVPTPDAGQSAPAAASMVDRQRFRYRLRVGAVATLKDSMEVGFRLSSGEPKGGAGMGDPISGNATFNNNAAKKFIYIDQAYAKWSGINTPDFSLVATVGKMENPFVFSEMIFDPDYTPEGAALNMVYNLTDQQALKLNGGGFMLHEFGASSRDPFMAGAIAMGCDVDAETANVRRRRAVIDREREVAGRK